jgi:hypothetical protein
MRSFGQGCLRPGAGLGRAGGAVEILWYASRASQPADS